MFSYHYQLHLIPAAKANYGLVNIQMRREATEYAIVKVLKILDSFKLPQLELFEQSENDS